MAKWRFAKNQDRSRKKIAPSVLLMRIAAAFFLPLLLTTAFLYFNQARLQKQYSAFVAGQSGKNIAVQAPIGTRTVVDLPDGSKVWLNSGSRLTYPAFFADNQREVRLEGEAFFDIEKESKPFLVQNSGPTVKVYGTRFNVNDYADEDHVVVALEEGSVALDLKGKEAFLHPGEVSVYHRNEHSLSIAKNDLEPLLCWKDGKLIFRNTSLDEIVRVLQRQYNVVFEFDDPSLAGYQYNATFRNESLEQILQLLKVSAPQMQFEYTKAYLTKDGKQVKGKVVVKRKKI
ncbi:FecR domain-containing protein [Mangrovibacterium marinum]|uniref:FecR family protein n=1 Tax=Mangrovibacterium marinum TaxID=1639118 RepID=UPI002A18767C|nr:FecR domain-containing protein [Mangrovibacterium marinum]